MSKVKVGNWVRVVIEDYVCGVDEDDGEIDLDEGGSYLMGSGNVVSIEAIPAPFVLPKKRWAQVLAGKTRLWTLGYDAELRETRWFDFHGYFITDEELLGYKDLGLRIISEGVDE
jgi:hypothetical protein